MENQIKTVRDIVKKLDPKIKEDDSAFKAAMVLVASAQVGPNTDKVARRAKLPRALVRKYGKRLRHQGIWRGRKIACEWFDKTSGGTAFWCDVCVAEGLMNRVSA